MTVTFSFLIGYGSVVNLDKCSFHDSVRLEDFANTRIMTIRPPEGEVCCEQSEESPV